MLAIEFVSKIAQSLKNMFMSNELVWRSQADVLQRVLLQLLSQFDSDAAQGLHRNNETRSLPALVFRVLFTMNLAMVRQPWSLSGRCVHPH